MGWFFSLAKMLKNGRFEKMSIISDLETLERKASRLTLFDQIKFDQNRPAGQIFNKIDRIQSSM